MLITPIKTPSFAYTGEKIFLSALQVFAASLFLIICSQIKIPLYFSPVPLTGQTFGVMLIGATLGSRLGLLSVITYIIEGSLGLPVFAFGAGAVNLMGPTGGYILGFLFQVYLVGWFFEHQKASRIGSTAILLVSCALQLALGTCWLSNFVGLKSAIMLGIIPFIFGEIMKVLSLTALLKNR